VAEVATEVAGATVPQPNDSKPAKKEKRPLGGEKAGAEAGVEALKNNAKNNATKTGADSEPSDAAAAGKMSSASRGATSHNSTEASNCTAGDAKTPVEAGKEGGAKNGAAGKTAPTASSPAKPKAPAVTASKGTRTASKDEKAVPAETAQLDPAATTGSSGAVTAGSGEEIGGTDGAVDVPAASTEAEATESGKEGGATETVKRGKDERGAEDAKGEKAERKDGGLLQQAKNMLSVLVGGTPASADSEEGMEGGAKANSTKPPNSTATDANSLSEASSKPSSDKIEPVDGVAHPAPATYTKPAAVKAAGAKAAGTKATGNKVASNKAAGTKATGNKIAVVNPSAVAAGNKTAAATLTASNKTGVSTKQPKQKVAAPGQAKVAPAQGKLAPPKSKQGNYESIFQTLTKKSKSRCSTRPSCQHLSQTADSQIPGDQPISVQQLLGSAEFKLPHSDR
jgi:hypothetical protein